MNQSIAKAAQRTTNYSVFSIKLASVTAVPLIAASIGGKPVIAQSTGRFEDANQIAFSKDKIIDRIRFSTPVCQDSLASQVGEVMQHYKICDRNLNSQNSSHYLSSKAFDPPQPSVSPTTAAPIEYHFTAPAATNLSETTPAKSDRSVSQTETEFVQKMMESTAEVSASGQDDTSSPNTAPVQPSVESTEASQASYSSTAPVLASNQELPSSPLNTGKPVPIPSTIPSQAQGTWNQPLTNPTAANNPFSAPANSSPYPPAYTSPALEFSQPFVPSPQTNLAPPAPIPSTIPSQAQGTWNQPLTSPTAANNPFSAPPNLSPSPPPYISPLPNSPATGFSQPSVPSFSPQPNLAPPAPIPSTIPSQAQGTWNQPLTNPTAANNPFSAPANSSPSPPPYTSPLPNSPAMGFSQPSVSSSQTNLAAPAPIPSTSSLSSDLLERGSTISSPVLQLQGASVLDTDDASARARVTLAYPVSSNVFIGGSLDLTDGNAFADSRNEGLQLNEMYLAASFDSLPNLRFAVGQLDLTSYFDRNSFAKDGATHFFNSTFQTNSALSVTGLGSRLGALVNWSVTDTLEAKAAAFSSARSLDDFQLDAFAGEVGLRYGNAIIRGTYATGRDAGSEDGFEEIFQIGRDDGTFGVDSSDQEEAYGINAEVFVPNLKLGLFGRYGWYNNLDLDEEAETYSIGFNFLDLVTPTDRLGLAYGRRLSNDHLRDESDNDTPDVLEAFYDFRFLRNLRLGFSVQGVDGFSDTLLGVRVKTEFDGFAF